jgi:hypothetical protein
MQEREVDSIAFELDARRASRTVAYVGLGAGVLLVLLDLVVVFAHDGRVGPFREIFWLTAEETVGTWFAASQTLLVGIVLIGIGLVARKVADQQPAWPWHLLGAIFVYLSMDDAAQVHESLGTVVEHATDLPQPLAGIVEAFPTYHWQLVFGLPLLALVYLVLGFAAPRLRCREAKRALIAAVCLLALAVVLDFLEGLPAGHPMNLAERIVGWVDLEAVSRAAFGEPAIITVGHLLRVVEEFVEMAAMTLLLALFTGHLVLTAVPLRLRRSGAPE